MYCISTDAYFDSAHFLPDYFGKCENIHGHRWKVTVELGIKELLSSGSEKDMVMDFSRFKQIVREEVAKFDHMFLVTEKSISTNLIEELQNAGFELLILPYRTTAENFAKDFYDRFNKMDLPVKSVEVQETPNNRAKYER